MQIVYHPIMYLEYIRPHGYLNEDPACHALFWYATCVSRHIYEGSKRAQYEGELSHTYDWEKQYVSTAQVYGVEPERLAKYWSAVNLQLSTLGLLAVPQNSKYRPTVNRRSYDT